MPKCPECGAARAYVGFSSVECRNPKCRHYKPQICPYCKKDGHFEEDCPNKTRIIDIEGEEPETEAEVDWDWDFG